MEIKINYKEGVENQVRNENDSSHGSPASLIRQTIG